MRQQAHRPSPLTVMGIYSNCLPPELQPEFDPLTPGALLGISFGFSNEPTPEVMAEADKAASEFLGLQVTSEKMGHQWLVWPVQSNPNSVQ